MVSKVDDNRPARDERTSPGTVSSSQWEQPHPLGDEEGVSELFALSLLF